MKLWISLLAGLLPALAIAQSVPEKRPEGPLRVLSRTQRYEPSSGHIPNNFSGKDDRVLAKSRPRVNTDAFALFGACTATHVGRGVFLTAGHCVDNQIGLQGYRTAPCPHTLRIRDLTQSVSCNVITYRFDKTTDYALLQVTDPAVVENLQSIPVDYGMDWRKMGARNVRLYGYSGEVLRMNESCTAKIEASRDRLIHDCDTQGGDSGSALVDTISDHIIGVHAGGLRESVNYGYPIAQVPWAESLCVAVTALEQQPLMNNGPPAVLRISTSHLPTVSQRMLLQLKGSFAKNRLRVKVFAPDTEMEIDPIWFKWTSSTRFSMQELLVLSAHGKGPWSVEISGFGTAKQTTKGYVDGRVLVCP